MQNNTSKITILGIDPGINGALAVISSTNGSLDVELYDIPHIIVTKTKKQKIIDIVEFKNLLKSQLERHQISFACIEDVHAFPGEGVSSAFRFGEAKGIILGLLIGLDCGYQLISPMIWKKKFQLSSDKKEVLSKAKILFPKIKFASEHQAEALFIGLYGLEKWKTLLLAESEQQD